MYRAGRFYELTPKSLEFVRVLEKWAEERGLSKEDIHTILKKLAEEQEPKQSIDDALAALEKKGFFTSESIFNGGDRT